MERLPDLAQMLVWRKVHGWMVEELQSRFDVEYFVECFEKEVIGLEAVRDGDPEEWDAEGAYDLQKAKDALESVEEELREFGGFLPGFDMRSVEGMEEEEQDDAWEAERRALGRYWLESDWLTLVEDVKFSDFVDEDG